MRDLMAFIAGAWCGAVVGYSLCCLMVAAKQRATWTEEPTLEKMREGGLL